MSVICLCPIRGASTWAAKFLLVTKADATRLLMSMAADLGKRTTDRMLMPQSREHSTHFRESMPVSLGHSDAGPMKSLDQRRMMMTLMIPTITNTILT